MLKKIVSLYINLQTLYRLDFYVNIWFLGGKANPVYQVPSQV